MFFLKTYKIFCSKITQVSDEKVLYLILPETYGFWAADSEHEFSFCVSRQVFF